MIRSALASVRRAAGRGTPGSRRTFVSGARSAQKEAADGGAGAGAGAGASAGAAKEGAASGSAGAKAVDGAAKASGGGGSNAGAYVAVALVTGTAVPLWFTSRKLQSDPDFARDFEKRLPGVYKVLDRVPSARDLVGSKGDGESKAKGAPASSAPASSSPAAKPAATAPKPELSEEEKAKKETKAKAGGCLLMFMG